MLADAASAVADRRTRKQSSFWQVMLVAPAGAILLVFRALQIVCIACALLYPDEFRYLSPQNLTILMKAIPVLGCLALGARHPDDCWRVRSVYRLGLHA